MKLRDVRFAFIMLTCILVIPTFGCNNNEEKKANSKANEIARDGRFIAYNNGTVLDTKTGLMWAANDNGEDVSWQHAKRYCENYRGGGYTDWRMPTQDEISLLYDPNKKNRHGYHVTKLIDISDCCLWVSETGGSKATLFSFLDRIPVSGASAHFLHILRALPVRGGR